MQTNLRPMTLGEILDRTAQLYRGNFALFAGIAAVYAGMLLVLNLLEIGLQELLRRLHMSQHLPWLTLGFVVLILPLVFIFAGAAVAANNRAVAWVNLDQPATIRGAYRSILPRLGRYLWLMTLIALFIYLPFALLSICYFMFLFVYARPMGLFIPGHAHLDPQASIILLLVTLAFFFLVMVALVYAIIMALRYSLALPASVLEDLTARKSLRRSIELSQGSRGRIFVLGLLISAIQLGLVAITQVFFLVAAFKQHGVLPVWAQIAQQIVGFFTNSFIGPMYATGLTLFYFDQRVRKEGYDIEMMMEAAGMTAPVLAAEPQLAATLHDPAPDPGPSALEAPPHREEPTPTSGEQA
ncbi:MAG TPA: hypothetical protein VGG56_17945 [Terracidiphilus sp.]|jgi:uncharacterized membrane protein